MRQSQNIKTDKVKLRAMKVFRFINSVTNKRQWQERTLATGQNLVRDQTHMGGSCCPSKGEGVRQGEDRKKKRTDSCRSQVLISLQRLSVGSDNHAADCRDPRRQIRETPAPREVNLMLSNVIPRRKDLSTFPRGAKVRCISTIQDKWIRFPRHMQFGARLASGHINIRFQP